MPALFALIIAAAAQSALPPSEASLPNPRASELFEREPALRDWALRFYDANRDGWLTLFEASAAAEAFRDMADNDRDGRVTTVEYRAGVAFISARY